MDDETKSVVTKLVDKFTNVVESVTAAASNAAQHAMESNARRMQPDPGQIAATANEQVYIPEANDAMAMPLPLIPAAAKKKPIAKKAKKAPKKAVARSVAGKSSKRAKKAKPTPGRNAKGSKKTAKKATRKASKKKKSRLH
jgi:hypothetical protein